MCCLVHSLYYVYIQSYGYNEIVKNEEQFHCVSSVLGLGLWPRLKGLTGHDSEASYTLHVYERYVFNLCSQNSDESIDEFLFSKQDKKTTYETHIALVSVYGELIQEDKQKNIDENSNAHKQSTYYKQ